MKLEELSESLKDTAAFIYCFVASTEMKSGQQFAEEYVEKNDLGYIREEILAAVKAGFIFSLRQSKAGKFDKSDEERKLA